MDARQFLPLLVLLAFLNSAIAQDDDAGGKCVLYY
jgi:hypothetical protein